MGFGNAKAAPILFNRVQMKFASNIKILCEIQTYNRRDTRKYVFERMLARTRACFYPMYTRLPIFRHVLFHVCRESASFYLFNEYITRARTRLCPATTTDEGIPRFSDNQMSGNGNVSRRGCLFTRENIFHAVSPANRSP